MSMKPCLVCGDVSDATRCPEHRTKDERVRPAERRTARWARLSKRLRKAQPFCLTCGSRDDLTVDHVIPVTIRPDLAFEVDNLAVLCRRCNSRKGTTVTKRDQTGGVTPTESDASPRRKAQGPSHTPRGYTLTTVRDA